MLQGYKTWIGLALTLLGFTGAYKYVTQEQVAQMLALISQVIGLAIAVYGNYDAHRRLNELK
jgi:cadmium resistance protein CadD (predicted permease)